MAERRMFTQKVIDSDAFLSMPLSTQALYFHLCMKVDDDGFVNNSKKIQIMVGATARDLRLLIAKQFIIDFKNSVVAIKHWKMHNFIRKDRYVPTQYVKEKAMLTVGKSGIYVKSPDLDTDMATVCQPNDTDLATVCQPNDTDLATVCQPNDTDLATVCQPNDDARYDGGIPFDNQMSPQYSIGKDSIGQDRVGEYSAEDVDSAEPTRAPEKQRYGEYGHVMLTDKQLSDLKAQYGEQTAQQAITYLDEYVEMKGYKVKNHYLAIKKWVVDAVNERQSLGKGAYGGLSFGVSGGELSQSSFDTDEFFKAAIAKSLNIPSDEAR